MGSVCVLSAYTLIYYEPEACAFLFLADGAKGLIDLDIIPPDDEGSSNDDEKRNALRNRASLWRDRIVPYVLDGSLSMAFNIK